MDEGHAEIELLDGTEIGIRPLAVGEEALSFFTLKGQSKALVSCTYTAERELRNLIEIAEDQGMDPVVRMGAIRMIRDHLREALLAEGMLGRVSASQTRDLGDGMTQTAQLEAVRLRPMLSQTARMLEEAKRIEEVIDASQEDSDDQESETKAIVRRDLGGGGICPSSQRAAREARARAAEAGPGSGCDSGAPSADEIVGVRSDADIVVPEGTEPHEHDQGQ